MLKDFFYGKELNKKLNPDEAIAYGATIEAAIQMGKYSEDVVLLDVCPFSLGIAVVNRIDDQVDQMLMSKVIERGSKLPCKKMETFYPATKALWFCAKKDNCQSTWYNQPLAGAYKNHCFYNSKDNKCFKTI